MSGIVPVLVITVFVFSGYSMSAPTYDLDIPPEIQNCLDLLQECSNTILSGDTTNKICLELSNSEKYHLTPKDLMYFRSLLLELVHEEKRFKRQTRRRFRRRRRIRKEVRRMRRSEWNDFVWAMQSLKRKGIYNTLAAIHRGVTIDSAHFGEAFLPWHRIYLLVMEQALRRERRRVTIPYWDCSLDYDLSDPRRSIVWTDEYFGNGNGTVVTGPFVWRTGQGEPLMRNTGAAGSLISKEHINLILSRRRHAEIMDPTNRDYYMEGYHNNPHVWVDGQLSLLDSSAEEPVFFMYHCFIDYLWQLFMNQQIYRFRINPYNDYPDVQGLHNGDNLMTPFNITNRIGYHQYWYNNFYTYQRSPTCSTWRPYCGSRHITCNMTLQRCVSTEGQFPIDNDNRNTPLQNSGVFALQAESAFRSAPTAVDKPVLRSGRRFTATVTDPRTSGHPLAQVSSASNVRLIRGKRSLRTFDFKTDYKNASEKVKHEICSNVNNMIKFVN